MWLAPPTPDKKTFEIAARLSKLEQNNDIDMFGPQIIGIMEAADADRFRTIDERPCYFNELDGRFWMLRQVRNHPVWGPRLSRAVSLTRRRTVRRTS